MNFSHEGNEGNVGNSGRGGAGGGGFEALSDRVDLPFITVGNVKKQRVPVTTWNERLWDREWLAWLMLGDFVEAATLPRAAPAPADRKIIACVPLHKNIGSGQVSFDPSMQTVAAHACLGTYRLKCTGGGSKATFELISPAGRQVHQFTYKTGTTEAIAVELIFKIRPPDSGPQEPFKKGDAFVFDVGVENGGKRSVWLDPPWKLSGQSLVITKADTGASQPGKGACSDPVISAPASLKPGVYRARCTVADAKNPRSFTFELLDPSDASLDTVATNSGVAAFSSILAFSITAGGVSFDKGDEFRFTTWNEKELDALIRLAEDERPDALGEIVAQNDSFQAYFLAALSASPKSHPKTALLMQIAALVGAHVSMHFKGLYQWPRPSHLAPGLLPPIRVPGHPAYPSGHSTQAHLMARCVAAALTTPASGTDRSGQIAILDTLAGRIARNREIAGLHYEFDTKAGIVLADAAFAALNSNAMPVLPATTVTRFHALLTEARKEW